MIADPTINKAGLVRRHAPATSKSAAALAFPRSGTQRKLVLGAVWRGYRSDRVGITRDEIAAQLDMSPNTVRPRVKELLDAGWIMPTGATRKTALGRDAEVLVLTPGARIEIERRIAAEQRA